MASSLVQIRLELYGRRLLPLKMSCGLLTRPLSWALDCVRESSVCQLMSGIPGLGRLHPDTAPFRLNWAGSVSVLGRDYASLQISACLPTTSHRHPKSIDHTASQQQISNLIDQQQSLKRQLAFAKQQQATSAEAGSRARARSQHHVRAVVVAEECVRRCAQETAQLQAQLTAQEVSEEHLAENCEGLELQVQGLEHQLQQSAAEEYRARTDLAMSKSSLRATQNALQREAAIIQSLERQLVAERTAAAVRAASVRVRATMQARKAASAQAQQLAAQNACLLADRKSLMQRLAALEQQRDGMLC